MTIVAKAFPDKAQYPFDKEYPHTVIVECEAYDEDDRADERMMAFLEKAGDLIEDGVVAQDRKQFDNLWFLRKGIITAA